MLDLLKEHWLAITSFVVALIGGVPGFLSIWKDWKARPQIAAYLRNLLLIHTSDVQGKPISGLILQLSIGNKGKDAIVPLAYMLECKIEDKWVRFKAATVPEGAAYVKAGERDLRPTDRAITRESPAVGFLAFAITEMTYEELHPLFTRMPKRLICIDLFRREHKIDLNDDLQP